MNYNYLRNISERRKGFLNDVINQGYDAYLYKTHDSYILISLTHSYKSISIVFTDAKTNIKYYIECLTNADEYVFNFYENEQMIDLIVDEIYQSHSLKMINCHSFCNYFKKERGNLLFKQNHHWETIDYAGLLIRHKFYHLRYSDFSTSNYVVTILGNPVYFSPYKKKPFEFEFFRSETTQFRHIYPVEMFMDIELEHYDGNNLIDLILERAFNYFFDGKEFVVMNYDEIYYGRRSFSIPEELLESIHVFSQDSLKFYTAEEGKQFALNLKPMAK